MKKALLLVTFSSFLSGCTLLGAAIDNNIDEKHHWHRDHQEGAPFTNLGLAVDVEIFKQLVFGHSDEEHQND